MKLEDCVKVIGGPAAMGTKFFLPSGAEIKGIIDFHIPLVTAQSMVVAKVSMLVNVEVLAQPVFDLAFVKAAAAAHGMRLVNVKQP